MNDLERKVVDLLTEITKRAKYIEDDNLCELTAQLVHDFGSPENATEAIKSGQVKVGQYCEECGQFCEECDPVDPNSNPHSTVQ